MKSKKIILGIALIAILVIGGIALNNSSKNSSTSQKDSSSATETDSNSDKEQLNTTEENKDKDKVNNEAPTNNSTSNKSNADPSNPNHAIDSPLKEAASKVMGFYFGEDSIKEQYFVPVSLEGKVAKRQDDSNIIYSDKEDFTDGKTDGLIIILNSTDDSNKKYKYEIKDISDDESMFTGVVLNDGTIQEDGGNLANPDENE